MSRHATKLGTTPPNLFFEEKARRINELFSCSVEDQEIAIKCAMKHGWVLEDFDPVGKERFKNVSVTWGAAEVQMFISGMVPSVQAEKVAALEAEYGLKKGDKVRYTNPSDYGWLQEQEHTIDMILPLGLTNGSKDCARVTMTPATRAEIGTWTQESCDKFNAREEGRDLKMDDIIERTHVVYLSQLTPINDWNGDLHRAKMKASKQAKELSAVLLTDEREDEVTKWFRENEESFMKTMAEIGELVTKL